MEYLGGGSALDLVSILKQLYTHTETYLTL